jgi:hypothetical protein
MISKTNAILSLVFFVGMGTSAIAQEIPIEVAPGQTQILPGPNSITYKVKCSAENTNPEPEARIICSILYSGGPRNGVSGEISTDKCYALETAVERCRRQMNSRDPNVLRFCNPDGAGYYGMGARCSDQHGTSVDVTMCDAEGLCLMEPLQ